MNQELGPQRAKVKHLYDPEVVFSKWDKLMEKMTSIFLSGSQKPGATELDGKGKTRVA